MTLLITMSPTAELVLVGDSMCRVWRGRTDAGLQVRVLVCAVACETTADDRELAAVLTQIPSPLRPGEQLM